MPDEEEVPGAEFEEEIEAESEESAEPVRKYAGKYDSVEDMEAAYEEAQRKIGEQGEELGRYRSTPPPSSQPDDLNAYKEQFATRLWENPLDTIAGLMNTGIQEYATTRDLAEANLETIIAEEEADPQFRNVQRRFIAEMKKRGGMNLANESMARQIAADVKRMVYGDMFLTRAQQAKVNPAARTAFLEELGIESPSARGGDGESEPLTRKEKDMLDQLNLTPEQKKRTLAAYRKRITEEE